jgi:small subunit ribosomal protein S18
MKTSYQDYENERGSSSEQRSRAIEDRNFRDRDENRHSMRKRPRPDPDLVFDYKDLDSIRSFVSDAGKLVPARISRLSSKQQRELTRQVKRARHLALLPISDSHDGR